MRATALVLLAGLGPLWLGGCVSLAEHRKLEYEVNRLKARMGSGSAGPGGERVADVAAEMEELRQRVAEVEGRVEVAEHRSTNALEEAQAARQDAARGGGGAVGGIPGGAGMSGTSPDAMGPPGLPPGAAVPVPAGDPGRAPSDGPGMEAAPSAEVVDYREAYDAWRADQHQECVDRFRQFLQTHPSSVYADDAAYWLADCHFKQGDFRNAVLRFDDVVRTYPTSDRAAEALYRQGEALLRLNHQKAAHTAFQRVVDEYPESARAAEAKRQLELLGSG